jgi:hypothetical protein
MSRSALRSAAPALLLAAVVLGPFLGKAFTIDDTLFLKQAQHVLSDPLHPTAFEAVWSELAAPLRMSALMPSGPVMAYLLVPCVMAGGEEWIAHLAQLLLFCAAIVSTAALASRLGLDERGSRAASLLLASTPAALAMAGTAMPDVPAMALGAIGLERVLAWKDGGRWHQGMAAALALALAALARSHLLLLVGAAALAIPGDFLSWSRWRKTRWIAWIPVLAAPLLALLGALLTRDPAGPATALAGAARTFSSPSNVGRNVVAFATHWSLVLPLGLPWLVLRWRALVRRPVTYVAAAAAALVLLLEGEGHRLFLIAPAAALGAAALWDILADGWRRRDATQAVLGLALLVALPVTLYLHMPSKYLLASAPLAAILVARALASRSRALVRALLCATVVLGVTLGVLILRADANFAGLGRRAAAELIAPEVAAGRNVWFAGHWGFQWYAEKAGARCLTITPPLPLHGDLAVSSLRSFGHAIHLYPERKLLATLEDGTPGGRIMSMNLGSGFYSNTWGYLPWAWGDEVLDSFSLWELE